MKYIITLILLCVIPFQIIAQELNYNDLINILNLKIVESNDYLENKGYRLYDSTLNGNDNDLKYTWDKTSYSPKTNSFLGISWNKLNSTKMVFYQFYNLSHFNYLRKNLEQLGVKLTDSYVESDGLYYKYNSSDSNYYIIMKKGVSSYDFSVVYNIRKVLRKEIIIRY